MSRRERLRIRAATPADREVAMRIAADAMIGFGIEPDFAGLDSDLGALGSNTKACAELVATMDGVVVGVAILTYSGDTAGKLTGFYVDPKWRGQGIGSALLAKASDAGRAAGLLRLPGPHSLALRFGAPQDILSHRGGAGIAGWQR